MQDKLKQLRSRLMEIEDLHGAASLLYWDQATYMPPEGAGPAEDAAEQGEAP